MLVERDDVHVNFTAGTVRQNEVPRPGVIPRTVRKPRGGQQAPQSRFQPGLDNDVEVGVRPGLPLQQGVHSPPSIDPDGDAGFLEHRVDRDGVGARHGQSASIPTCASSAST
jgi:hypothetical protein